MDKKRLRSKVKNRRISIVIAAGSAILSYLIFGAVTSIVKNRFFTRMTPVGWVEQTSLVITSLLLGIYFGLAYYAKSSNKVCNASATAGGIFGFLTFGCSICNKILVFFLGVAGVLTYFDPLRPYLGILSVGFLGFSIYKKTRTIAA